MKAVKGTSGSETGNAASSGTSSTLAPQAASEIRQRNVLQTDAILQRRLAGDPQTSPPAGRAASAVEGASPPEGGSAVQLRRATVAGDDAGYRGSTSASALPDPVRSQMESSFAADFSDVRVRESGSASALGADAYTKGNEITFAPGRFQPSAKEGKELLGHELSHVVQQRAGRVSTPQAHGGTAVNADTSLEREADEHGAKAARGEPVGLPGAAATGAAATGAAASGATATGSVQLKKGKANRRLKVTIAGTGVVELPRGTQIDTQDEGTLLICSGQHAGKTATFDRLDDGAVEFEKEVRIGTHEVYKGCSTGFVGRPKATALSGNTLTVVVTLQTRNVYDRATWTSRVVTSTSPDTLEAATFIGARDDDDVHVQNPAWRRGNQPIPDKSIGGEGNDPSPHGYAFRPDFDGYDGASPPSALRTITFQYNLGCLKRAAQKKLGLQGVATLEDVQRADVWIALGINCRYDERGLTPSYKSRDADPLGATCPEHMYGVTAMSTPWQNGLVDMSAVVDQRSVEHMSKEEFMGQELPPNPTNNLELVFPEDYLEHHGELAPLVPARFLDLDENDTPSLGMDRSSKEIQLKLQTRIESEATLKVGSKDALHATVEQLRSMGETINEIMGGDETLGSFNWTLTPTETLVFTDEYMDDSKCTALRSGIGIRKRRSSTASKLNVKTGKGYQVHEPTHAPAPGERYPEDRERGAKSDIYRRHEVGFSLNPEATPEEIGAFLESGFTSDDPWNLGANEAMTGVARDMEEKGIPEFDPINFAELQTQMVLMGFRRKFNLCAKPKSGQGVINIEISCDHTVGCKPADIPLEIPDAEGFEAYFAKLSREKYPEVFNVEMELEHLGAGGASPSGGSDSGRSKMQALRSKWGHQEKKSTAPESAPKAPPKGFPTRRPYQRPDSDSPNFNTPSFSVFYAAHERVIEALQTSLKDEVDSDYLQSDKQKLESLRDKLGLLDDVSGVSPQPRVSSGGHTRKAKHSDTGPSTSHREKREGKQRDRTTSFHAEELRSLVGQGRTREAVQFLSDLRSEKIDKEQLRKPMLELLDRVIGEAGLDAIPLCHDLMVPLVGTIEPFAPCLAKIKCGEKDFVAQCERLEREARKTVLVERAKRLIGFDQCLQFAYTAHEVCGRIPDEIMTLIIQAILAKEDVAGLHALASLRHPLVEAMLYPEEHRHEVERDNQTTSPSRSRVTSPHDSFSPPPSGLETRVDEKAPTKAPTIDPSVGTPVLVTTPTQVELKSYRLKEKVKISNTALLKGDRVTVLELKGETVKVRYFTLAGHKEGDMPASALDLSTGK